MLQIRAKIFTFVLNPNSIPCITYKYMYTVTLCVYTCMSKCVITTVILILNSIFDSKILVLSMNLFHFNIVFNDNSQFIIFLFGVSIFPTQIDNSNIYISISQYRLIGVIHYNHAKYTKPFHISISIFHLY